MSKILLQFPRYTTSLLRARSPIFCLRKGTPLSPALHISRRWTSSSSSNNKPASTVQYEGQYIPFIRLSKTITLSTLLVGSYIAPKFFLSAPYALWMRCTGTLFLTMPIVVGTAALTWFVNRYVIAMRSINENGNIIQEFTTQNILFQKRTTRIYDPAFLVEGKGGVRWTLAESVQSKSSTPGEETVAQTLNASGDVLGSWIVEWDEHGQGKCHGEGRILSVFVTHDLFKKGL